MVTATKHKRSGRSQSEVFAEFSKRFGPIWDDPELAVRALWKSKVWREGDGPVPEGERAVTPQQMDFRRAFRTHKQISVRSANGMGKTHTLAEIIVEFMLTHFPCYVVVTSASWDQMMDTLYPQIEARVEEIRQIFPFLRPINRRGWWPLGRKVQWGLQFISPNKATRAAGRHNRNVMIVVDEASGLEPKMLDAFKGCLTRPGDILALTGNPLEDAGPFYDTHHSLRSEWKCLHFDAEESPNVRSQRVGGPIIFPNMTSLDWVLKREREWKERDPVAYWARVRGEFPSQGSMTIISRELIEQAMRRWRQVTDDGRRPLPVMGARRFGADIGESADGDPTILVSTSDAGIHEFEEHIGLDPLASELLINGRLEDWGVDEGGVDDGGLAGMSVRLRARGHHNIEGYKGGETPHDETNFSNARTEGLFAVRDWLREGAAIPEAYGKKLLDEAGTKYKYLPNDKKQAEAKKDVKERIGRSTDYHDALLIARRKRPGQELVKTASEDDGYILRSSPLLIPMTKDESVSTWGLTMRDVMAEDGDKVRPGNLFRGFWLGRNMPSACVVLHRESFFLRPGEARWTLTDCVLQEARESLDDWLERVLARCRFGSVAHAYWGDFASSDDDKEELYRFQDSMIRKDEKMGAKGFGGSVSIPGWIEPARIDGKSGLDEIERLVGLANRGAEFSGLRVYPREVISSLRLSRSGKVRHSGQMSGEVKEAVEVGSVLRAMKAVFVGLV